MSKFVIVDQILGNPMSPATATATIQQFPLGLIVNATDAATGGTSVNRGGGQFIYAQGSNVTAIGQVVMLSNNSAVLLASANSVSFFPLGVAAGNISATNVFGWVQINGVCDYMLATNSSIGAGVPLYMAGTSGILITNAAAGSRIVGIVAPNSYTSSQTSVTVQLFNPHFLGVTAGL